MGPAEKTGVPAVSHEPAAGLAAARAAGTSLLLFGAASGAGAAPAAAGASAAGALLDNKLRADLAEAAPAELALGSFLGPSAGCGEELPAGGNLSPPRCAFWPLLEELRRAGLEATLLNVSEKPLWAAGALVCPASALN